MRQERNFKFSFFTNFISQKLIPNDLRFWSFHSWQWQTSAITSSCSSFLALFRASSGVVELAVSECIGVWCLREIHKNFNSARILLHVRCERRRVRKIVKKWSEASQPSLLCLFMFITFIMLLYESSDENNFQFFFSSLLFVIKNVFASLTSHES